MKIHLIIFLGPNLKNNRRGWSPMNVNAAIVNIMNGVGLFPSQAPPFGTKERNTVILLLSRSASGLHSGKWLGPAALSQVTSGNTHVPWTELATGCNCAPHKRKRSGSQGLSPAEFRHMRAHACTHTYGTHPGNLPPQKGKFKLSAHACV